MPSRRNDDGGLRALFREHLGGTDFHVDTNERSHRGSPGSPDVNYAFLGGEGWIECKKADAWRPKFEVPQIGWLTLRAKLKTRVWIAVRRAETELWLLPGGCVRDLQKYGLRDPRVLPRAFMTEAQRPALWDWGAVRRLLTHAPMEYI